LLGGLVLYGVSDSLLVIARLGLDPWDVLNQGLARHTGLPIGTWAILVGVVVLALWIPLRQRPGVGTLANVMLIGSTMDLVLSLAPPAHGADRWVIMFVGVALNAIATGLYIGGMLGPGPRDGLMLGISARGHSIRVVRTSIEATVLLAGWLLGGQVGFGTLTYAIAIGPLVHVLIPFLRVKLVESTE
ncbi:MAG: membrane protein YczE, partial [Ferrimicrobium acidiphilum]